MAVYTFRPPTVDEGPAAWDNPLFLRVKLTRGITVVEGPPGTYRAVRFPTQDELREASSYWLGGHEYEVDASTRSALIAAGIGVNSSNFDNFAPGYGQGAFGSGPYGA